MDKPSDASSGKGSQHMSLMIRGEFEKGELIVVKSLYPGFEIKD